MKKAFAVAVIGLLLWIGWNIQQRENRHAEAVEEAGQQSAAYLQCVEHAKYPGVCIPPD